MLILIIVFIIFCIIIFIQPIKGCNEVWEENEKKFNRYIKRQFKKR